jgi:pSer/pThr/pTyr-binding forkhead associated (FHA) protein
MSGARLQVRDALGTWIRVIDGSPFTIGRRDTNSLQLGAAEVSREHAEIVVDKGRYLLRDRQSRYGTFIGGESVTERELQTGDEIRLGREAGGAELRFRGRR